MYTWINCDEDGEDDAVAVADEGAQKKIGKKRIYKILCISVIIVN